MRLLFEERLRGDENSGRAIAALRGAEVGEALLQGMKAAVCGDALDRDDVPRVAFRCQHQAGKHRLAVKEHCARTALAKLASVLGTGQLEIFAQHLEQGLVAVHQDLDGLVVDGTREADLHDRAVPFDRSVRTTENARGAAGVRLAIPRTRNRVITSPTAAAVSAPSGRNHVTVQFIAPSIARATMAGFMSTSSPARMPSAVIRRTACS